MLHRGQVLFGYISAGGAIKPMNFNLLAVLIAFLFIVTTPLAADSFDECSAIMRKLIKKPGDSFRVQLKLITTDAEARKLKTILKDPRMSSYSVNGNTPEKIVAEHLKSPFRDLFESVSAHYGVYLGEELIGSAKLGYFPKKKAASIAYAIAPDYQGLGLATEAVGTLVQFALENLKVEYFAVPIKRKNLPSIAVVKKLGFSDDTQPFEGQSNMDWYFLDPQDFTLKQKK